MTDFQFAVFLSIVSTGLSVTALIISYHTLRLTNRVTGQINRNIDLMIENNQNMQEAISFLQVQEAKRMNAEKKMDLDKASYISEQGRKYPNN